MSTQAKANAILLLAIVACCLDGFTTWLAFNTGRFREHSPGTAALIQQLGLGSGLAVSILARVVVFAALAVGIERFTRGRLALLSIASLATAITWLIVLSNIAALSTIQ
jgi:hypothetical protein